MEKYELTSGIIVVWIISVFVFVTGVYIINLDLGAISDIVRLFINPDFFFKWYHLVLLGLIVIPIVYWDEKRKK